MDQAVAVLPSCWEPATESAASTTPFLSGSFHTFTSAPAAAVPVMVSVAVLTLTGADGLVTVGAGGTVESAVMVGTAVAAETFPAASVAITLKLLAAFWVSGTEMEKLADVPLTICEPA